jgi:acetyl-CoA acetyltransferase
VANPNAVLADRALTIDDYLTSRMIATPLRLPDFCLEIDGGAAIVVAAPGLAADAKRKPVDILAADRNLERGGDTPTLYVDRLERIAPPGGRDIFRLAGIRPSDVDVASIYDATSVMVLMALEDFGFCERGEAASFVLAGSTGPAGRLPTNTNGGMLSEGYLHGINNLVELVRQMRGESVNQVGGAKIGFYTVGNGSLLLGAS